MKSIIFYFDKRIKELESEMRFNDSLFYLESLYIKNHSIEILNSLIGFSWYYFIEGPIESKRYDKEDTTKSFEYWKKYVDEAINNFYNCEASTLFICGYTLSLHGFFLEKTYEQKASLFIKQSLENCKDESLFELIKTFQAMSNQKKYKPLKISDKYLMDLFDTNSLIGKYFIEIYKQ